MSGILDAVFVTALMFVGNFLFITGLLAMSGGHNMHRIGLSTPRRGMIAMIVGIILFTSGLSVLN